MAAEHGHMFRDVRDAHALAEHLAWSHELSGSLTLLHETTLTALCSRHEREHGIGRGAGDIWPRPEEVDPMTETEFRALWGDR